jgi:hypothetical protein
MREEKQKMTTTAKIYLGAVIGRGAVLMALSLDQLHPVDPAQLAVLLALALVGSGRKVRLPMRSLRYLNGGTRSPFPAEPLPPAGTIVSLRAVRRKSGTAGNSSDPTSRASHFDVAHPSLGHGTNNSSAKDSRPP